MQPEFEPRATIFDRLAAASAAGRREIILEQIRAHPDGGLDLSAADGRHAVLDGVALGDGATADGTTVRLNLRGARLQGAHLGLADLRGADLSGADLGGAVLRGADLRGASLERANLAGADLAGAKLDGASLGEAVLRGAMLEDAVLRAARLRFADLRGAVLEAADLRKADLWGAVLENAVLARADLSEAVLEEAKLQGADLSGVTLRGTVLGQADLRRARLRGVTLQDAVLGNANLEGAILTDTRLQGVDLSRCSLTGVHFFGAWLEKTRLRQSQLEGGLGEERDGKFEEARLAYLALERNFIDLGEPNAASWAYRKKRRMEKAHARASARAAAAEGRWRVAAGWYAKYAGDQAIEWLCDYGESVSRVLTAIAVLYVLFTLVYGLSDGVVRVIETPTGRVIVPSRNPVDWAIFSLSGMTTSGKQPVGLLPRNEWIQLLTGVQNLLAIALAGLVGFVFGNSARR